MRTGETLATLPLALDAPDTSGRIRQLAQLPTASLRPGAYTLRLIVSHRGQREVREAVFVLTE